MNGVQAGDWYDSVYYAHKTGKRICQESIHDLKKAHRRLREVLQYFHIRLPPQATALDIGCGLGYYTCCLHMLGFSAVGIDRSSRAIECASSAFPEIQFQCASFPQDIQGRFDLIWAVDLSIINTFEVSTIVAFIQNARQLLNPSGQIIVGWHTDFTGKAVNNWSNWNWKTLNKIRQAAKLIGPAVVQLKYPVLNYAALRAFRLYHQKTPIFFALKTV
jgi:SAM-dependent methyltransferase